MTKLALFLYCHSLRGKNSQVRVLWEDQCVAGSLIATRFTRRIAIRTVVLTTVVLVCVVAHSRNDLFINGFGLFTSAAGAKIAWWMVSRC